MKNLLLLLLPPLLFMEVSLAQSASTKYSIRGIVRDSVSASPLGYVTVSVSDSSRVVMAGYTDDRGAYNLSVPRGNYTIKYTLLGYSPAVRVVEVSKATVMMEDVSLMEGVEIAQAVVTAQLVTTDIDKTTYNTSADPETPVLTALEMMKKVPMITVDGEDNIKLKGQGNFKILVNGKSSTLMSNNYKDVLKSMPASSIKNIEVITNPPAKYDAEGIGGIINIITNRKVPDGFSGSVWTGGDIFGGWNLGTYMAATTGKFNFSGTLYGGEYRNPGNIVTALRENYNSDNFRYQDYTSSSTWNGNYKGLNLEASYEFDTLNLLTLSMSSNLGDRYQYNDATTTMFNSAHQITSQYTNDNTSNNSWGSVGISLDYQRTFKKPEQTFTASYKFDYNPNNSGYDSRVDALQGFATSYHNRSDNKAWGAEHVIQLDYFDPITKNHQLEAGIKYTMRPNVSNSLNETYVGGEWVENPVLRNDLDYLQHVAAAYGAYQYKLEKFSAKSGVRAEYTINDGEFKMLVNQPLFTRYFNLVPYITFGYKINDASNLRLGYTQRLSRPGIWLLNPYVDMSEPVDIRTGNPSLMPELTHSFDLTYGTYKPKFNINTSLSVMLTNNSIEQVSMPQDNGAMITMPKNIGRRSSYMADLSGGVRLWNNKLKINLNLNGGYVMVDANNGSGIKNQGWQGNGYLYGNVNTWKNGQFTFGGGVFVNEIGLQSYEKFYYYYSFGVSQQLLDKKMRIALNIQNPFTTYSYFHLSTGDSSFNQRLSIDSRRQMLRLNLSYRFGQAKGGVKKTSRTIENTDLKGGGKSGGTEGAQ